MKREELKTQVVEEIDRRLPEFKDLLRDIVRIPTDNTTACVAYLAEYLKGRGLPADVLATRKHGPSIRTPESAGTAGSWVAASGT